MIATTFITLLSLVPLQDGLAREKAEEIDKLFARWNRVASPGCVIAVYERGEMTYGEGFGAANLEHRAPIETETVFRIASTSKQFTAACGAPAGVNPRRRRRNLTTTQGLPQHDPEQHPSCAIRGP